MAATQRPPNFFLALALFLVLMGTSVLCGEVKLAMSADFKELLDAEWKKFQPNIIPRSPEPPKRWWRYSVSPPFPSVWPPTPNLTLYYYVYAESHDFAGRLADGIYLAAPWGRVEVGMKKKTPLKFSLLSYKIKEIGIQGVRPLNEDELAIYRRRDFAEAYLADLTALPDGNEKAVQELKAYYCLWRSNNGIAEEIRPYYEQFFQWLECK
jgi:hypothetical protein